VVLPYEVVLVGAGSTRPRRPAGARRSYVPSRSIHGLHRGACLGRPVQAAGAQRSGAGAAWPRCWTGSCTLGGESVRRHGEEESLEP
jgi:hypothetical protein